MLNNTAQRQPTHVPFTQPDILIFKTNVQSQIDLFRIKRFLNRHPLIQQWNIDLEDIDKVLRIVSTQLQHHHIIDMLTKHGYCCAELV